MKKVFASCLAICVFAFPAMAQLPLGPGPEMAGDSPPKIQVPHMGPGPQMTGFGAPQMGPGPQIPSVHIPSAHIPSTHIPSFHMPTQGAGPQIPSINMGPGPQMNGHWHHHWGPDRRHHYHHHHHHWHPRHYDGDAAADAMLGALAGLAIGSIVANPPSQYQTVWIDGKEYLESNGQYYEKVPSGYQLVNPYQPQPTYGYNHPGYTDGYGRPAQSYGYAQPVYVDIHNFNGSITPVKLTPSGSGYVGPKGEFYDTLPTAKQLAPYYGLKPEDAPKAAN